MQTLNRRIFLAGGAIAAVGLATGQAARAQSRNVIDTLAGDSRFSRFVELASRAGAVDQLRSAHAVTVFAPTNDAFQRANSSRISELLSQGTGGGGSGQGGGGGNIDNSPDMLRLRSLIGYHIIPGVMLTSAQLAGDHQYKTFSGGMLRVASQGGNLAVTNPAPEQQSSTFGAGGLNVMPPAAIEQPDIVATNGIIHAISQVLFP